MAQRPVEIFISYSHRDEPLREELEHQLALLKNLGRINIWQDRAIRAGDDWNQEILTAFDAADIILLLASPRFFASEFCYKKEMPRALMRHEQGSARVIPVVLDFCQWQIAPFAHLGVRPTDGVPVTKWNNRYEAWLNVVEGITTVVNDLYGPEEPDADGWNELPKNINDAEAEPLGNIPAQSMGRSKPDDSGKVADSIGVFAQSGAVVHIRDIVLSHPTDQKQATLKKIYLSVFAASLTLITILGGWLFIARDRVSQSALILNREIGGEADPSHLPIARSLLNQADRFAQNNNASDTQKALNHYRSVIDYAASLYKSESDQTELTALPQCSERVSNSRESLNLLCDAQGKLVDLIQARYFPLLEEQLTSGPIGVVVPDKRGKDFKGMYTEGALRTTYGILVREDGIWADQGDEDGFVNTQTEALKLPCPQLESIEELWKDIRGDACGWIDPDTLYVDVSPDCTDLGGYTLTDSIFLSGKQPVEDRLKICGIIPADAQRKPDG